VLFGGPQQDTQRQSINYRVLVFPVCISIAGVWFDEWFASRTSDGMSLGVVTGGGGGVGSSSSS
jgi:hypothetical protein